MEEQKKIGVFLARFQPLHNAHLYVIKTALKECDKVVIMLGSSNKKSMLRNPYDFRLRYELLQASLSNDMDKISIYELPDWSKEDTMEDDLTWGSYLYYNIVARVHQKKFSFYYSDSPEIVKGWFSPEIIKNIDFRFMERNKIYSGLSSTKIRTAMVKFDPEDQQYLKDCLPAAVYSRINELRGIWLDIYNNPKNDFSMK